MTFVGDEAMKRFTAILAGFALLAMAGCGSSGSNDIPDLQPVGLLSAVTDVAAFETSGLFPSFARELRVIADAGSTVLADVLP